MLLLVLKLRSVRTCAASGPDIAATGAPGRIDGSGDGAPRAKETGET